MSPPSPPPTCPPAQALPARGLRPHRRGGCGRAAAGGRAGGGGSRGGRNGGAPPGAAPRAARPAPRRRGSGPPLGARRLRTAGAPDLAGGGVSKRPLFDGISVYRVYSLISTCFLLLLPRLLGTPVRGGGAPGRSPAAGRGLPPSSSPSGRCEDGPETPAQVTRLSLGAADTPERGAAARQTPDPRPAPGRPAARQRPAPPAPKAPAKRRPPDGAGGPEPPTRAGGSGAGCPRHGGALRPAAAHREDVGRR